VREQFLEPIQAIVADVSFISLAKALPAPLALAAPGAWLVALAKPQFEAGRKAIGKGGIVRDPIVREAAAAQVASWIGSQPGWHVTGVLASPIEGGSGNQEYLLGASFDG
jgi:23S rRNA (cytidine1920-2'-O)/16S rRNA (cytidine1409-2'-O)-methyltransferase